MPEIGEVARIVHYLRKSLVGKTLAVIQAQDDTNVFGKVGTTAAEFQKALTGKKVVDAGQQGKYFWLIMSSPPHPVFHFGMTGWIQIRGEQTYYYKPKKDDQATEWPPKYWKFTMETAGSPKVEAAFTDFRRLSRIRLVDCSAENIRKTTPLKENGPDPVIDKDILTEEWLTQKMKRKHVPVKALLLDQANISGIGNWVSDEILYHAKLHPEQYSDTFSSAQLSQLHASMLHVCQTAVDTLADWEKFPDDWLFKHRWVKGKKDAKMELPNGAKITFLKVGGRTSCVVPSVQKKTGAVAGDVKVEENDTPASGKGQKNKRASAVVEKSEEDEDDDEAMDVKPKSKKQKADATPKDTKKAKVNGVTKLEQDSKAQEELSEMGRRRSGRVTKAKV